MRLLYLNNARLHQARPLDGHPAHVAYEWSYRVGIGGRATRLHYLLIYLDHFSRLDIKIWGGMTNTSLTGLSSPSIWTKENGWNLDAGIRQ